MKIIIKGVTAASLFVVIAGSLVACNRGTVPNNTNQTQGYEENGYRANNTTPHYDRARSYNVHNDGVRSYGGAASQNNARIRTNGTTSNNQTIADRITQVAATVPGVVDATTVVHGNNAVIGLDISTPDRTSVERQVHDTVQAAVPKYRVHTTANGALHQRIRALNVNKDAKKGHSIRTLSNDVETIIRDISRTATAPFR